MKRKRENNSDIILSKFNCPIRHKYVKIIGICTNCSFYIMTSDGYDYCNYNKKTKEIKR